MEIVSAPKVYGFDTGFVCAHQGWPELRREDLGVLWEHFVLHELIARTQSSEWRYRRDSRGIRAARCDAEVVRDFTPVG